VNSSWKRRKFKKRFTVKSSATKSTFWRAMNQTICRELTRLWSRKMHLLASLKMLKIHLLTHRLKQSLRNRSDVCIVLLEQRQMESLIQVLSKRSWIQLHLPWLKTPRTSSTSSLKNSTSSKNQIISSKNSQRHGNKSRRRSVQLIWSRTNNLNSRESKSSTRREQLIRIRRRGRKVVSHLWPGYLHPR